LDPLASKPVAADGRRPALVAVGDQLEDRLAADAVEGHEAELVDAQDVEREQAPLQATELTRITGLEQLADEIGRPCEEHLTLLLRRLDAESERQMRLAGPDRPRQDQILRLCHPLAAGQRVGLGRAHALGRRKVKGVEVPALVGNGPDEPRLVCRLHPSPRTAGGALRSESRRRSK
jgi:hypothetical protein